LSYQVIAILTGFLLPSDRGCPYQVIVDQSVSTSSLGVTRSCNGPTK
jgi:hypothetical protein